MFKRPHQLRPSEKDKKKHFQKSFAVFNSGDILVGSHRRETCAKLALASASSLLKYTERAVR